jgi:hypothetical protein
MLAVCTFIGGHAQQDITLDGEWQLQIGEKEERVPILHMAWLSLANMWSRPCAR